MTPKKAEQDWKEFADYVLIYAIDDDIKNEVAGKRVPGGVDSWNKHWLLRIKHLQKGGRKDSQKYIGYIITSRHNAGLPPIEGYVFEPEEGKGK